MLALLACSPAFAQDCDSSTDLDADCDGDGWSPNQGDCADDERNQNPGVAEVCDDQLDNNCDGFFDEECEVAVRQGSMRGGGGCTREQSGTTGGTTVALLLLPILGRRRT